MILAIKVSNKNNQAIKVQEILSKYNSKISTRVGFNKNECGIIVLNIENENGCGCGCSSEKTNLQKDLETIEGIQVKKICFND